MAFSNSSTDTSPIFFYGKRNKTYEFLSQFYPCEFSENGRDYSSCEQYFHVQKAILFGDRKSEDKMFRSKNPKRHKFLGGRVEPFDSETWNQFNFDVVVTGNYFKFKHSKDAEKLASQLLDTGSRELVEASPRDRIWGIGFSAKDAEENRPHWGQNLLGEALMIIRQHLKELQDDKNAEAED